MVKHAGVHYILNQWRPGSKDWTWGEEMGDIQGRECCCCGEKAHHYDKIALLLQTQGWVGKPILLGDDGRIWDGHHRLLACLELGIEEVPVELGYTPNEKID
jgi:hypothetical protein